MSTATAAAGSPSRLSIGGRGGDATVERFRAHGRLNTPELSRALEGVETFARVVALHDGDTLTAVFDAIGGAFYQLHVRIDGIDACEMTAHAAPNRRLAIAARDRLLSLVTGNVSPPNSDKAAIEGLLASDVFMVRVRCGRLDKYGRLLGKVSSAYADSMSPSFGDVLIAERLAYEYRGGTRLSEEAQLDAMGRDADGNPKTPTLEQPVKAQMQTWPDGGHWFRRWIGGGGGATTTTSGSSV